MSKFREKPPILIVVADDQPRWDAYSLNPVPTLRDRKLLRILQSMGGINEKVEPGTYHFNADQGLIKTKVSLIKLED